MKFKIDRHEFFENLRTEYSEIGRYATQIVTFRFTILSLYLLAVGVFTTSGLSFGKSLLMFVITIGVWMLELRNRSLLSNICERAVQIETEFWGNYSPKNISNPFLVIKIRKY